MKKIVGNYWGLYGASLAIAVVSAVVAVQSAPKWETLPASAPSGDVALQQVGVLSDVLLAVLLAVLVAALSIPSRVRPLWGVGAAALCVAALWDARSGGDSGGLAWIMGQVMIGALVAHVVVLARRWRRTRHVVLRPVSEF